MTSDDRSDERAALLAKPQGDLWATVRLATTAGAGLVADGYDLQVINLVLAMLSGLYPEFASPDAKGFAASTTLAGVVMGMLFFGALADAIGRRTASLLTAMLTIFGAGFSACVMSYGKVSILVWFGICRFFLGVGIGGEYPLSAALSKEVSMSDRPLVLTRLQLLCVNMACYNVGTCIQASLVLILLATPLSMEAAWRIALAGGMLPSCIALVNRLRIEEPLIANASGDVSSRSWRRYIADFVSTIGSHWWILAGCCLSWFFFNIMAYSMSTFGSLLVETILGVDGLEHRAVVQRDARVAFAIGALQIFGCFLGSISLTHLSGPTNQLLGFGGLSVIYWLMGSLYTVSSTSFQMCGYLTWSLICALVGLTTYCCPAEGFPDSIRGSCMGLAAASGKTGAMLGTAIFPMALDTYGLPRVLIASGFIGACGFASTFMLWNISTSRDKLKE
mmetsp:Transcript_130595/g.227046  ORF Transcript_130595/g.227046 Transcript_130595/m.227046 type:complete len:449 (-) Transcript_130595:57-1403(-)